MSPFALVPLGLFVLIVTSPLPSAVSKVATVISEAGMAAVSSNNEPVSSVSGVAVPLATTVISVGSSSSMPASPFGARRSTYPRNRRNSLPDTSTNPPLPRSEPPRTEIVPRKSVALSAQTMALPPLPDTTASTLIRASGPMTVCSAFRTSGFRP